MLTKNDCLSILVRMEDEGKDINPYMKKLIIAKEPPIEVLQFIAQNQGIEAVNFYEMLRKKHNKEKSPLYTNILTGKQDIITTLSCLLVQIVLYSNKLEDKTSFLKEIRAEEISRVLNEYFKTGELENCQKLLSLIKTDLMVLEYLNGRRELN